MLANQAIPVYVPHHDSYHPLAKQTEPMDASPLLDPAILQAARQIYQAYADAHKGRGPQPLGVAIDRFTHRGQIVFTKRPILLPQECFVSLAQLESRPF